MWYSAQIVNTVCVWAAVEAGRVRFPRQWIASARSLGVKVHLVFFYKRANNRPARRVNRRTDRSANDGAANCTGGGSLSGRSIPGCQSHNAKRCRS